MATAKKIVTIAEPENLAGVTLMRLRSENVKRLSIVDVTFRDGVTTIGGDNGAGKSSFLDSLKFLLAGKAEIDAQPIHNGQQVKLRVIRTLMKVGDTEFTTDIDIEIPGFIAPSKVQDFLNKLANGMSFDPMEFDAMDDKAQFATMRSFVSGFDFEKNARDRKAAFDARTQVNGFAKRAQSAADAIVVTPVAPAELIDVDALTKQLKDAGDHNTLLEQRRTNRQNATTRIEHVEAEAQRLINEATADIEAEAARSKASVTEWQDQIAALEAKIKGEASRLKTACETISSSATDKGEVLMKEGEELLARLANAEPLPDPIDASLIEAQLAKARDVNKVVDDWTAQTNRRKEHQAEANELTQQSEDLTATITDLNEQKASAIRKAHLPIDGLGFGDDFITLHGVPWNQASTAQRIDASTAIAMALNPRIKVILIHDGSNLGAKVKERIAQRASAQGYRVLMEVVDESGANSHVFIEDGQIGKPHTKAIEAA